MNRLVRMWARPRTSRRTLVFIVDRPRRIDRVIDYFGGLVPARLAGAPGDAVGISGSTGMTRRMAPARGWRRG